MPFFKSSLSRKIIATVGPSSFDEYIIQRMDLSGVDIFRINLSHTKVEDLKEVIEKLRSWTSKRLCIDTEGAQIRTGNFENNTIEVKAHAKVQFVPSHELGVEGKIPIYPQSELEKLHLGDVLKIDFNNVIVQITDIEEGNILGRVLEGGLIGSNKGVSCDRKFSMPPSPFTAKDKKAFEIAKQLGITTIALSFASSGAEVERLRTYFDSSIEVISKIESAMGLTRLEDICEKTDAILIDRGDLSRDVSIEKIAFAQMYIQKISQEYDKPVYVATNLLESMITNYRPTRAEVHDIVSCLSLGADGLVLAAETSIGKYPVEAVRLVNRIIKEYEFQNELSLDCDYLCSTPTQLLIEPHGGELVQQHLWGFDKSRLKDIPLLDVSDEILSDIVQIAEGTYSPVSGFMSRDTLESVLERYQLSSGVSWTLPILLQVSKAVAQGLPESGHLGVRRRTDGNVYAIIEITGKEEIKSMRNVARKWFETDDENHPGVCDFLRRGSVLIEGKPYLIDKPILSSPHLTLLPSQTRNLFNDFGWYNIVGFHSRNVIHRGHEYIQKQALRDIDADALFISPVIGRKKAGDFTARSIVMCYETMIKNGHYNPYGVVLSTFNTYSRYSGPREAVFTAICRKNFGCSHFIIGRDHTGVGNYYSPDASGKLFDKVDVGMGLLFFDTARYCSKCDDVSTGCIHNGKFSRELSGTKIRTTLIEGNSLPAYLMRCDVAEILQTMYKENPEAIFEGPA